MGRIVHVISADADMQTRRSVEILIAGNMGGSGAVIEFPRASNPLDWARSVLNIRSQCGIGDVLHAWGSKSLGLCALSSEQELFYAPDATAGRKSVRLLRAIAAYRSVKVICSSQALHRLHVSRGIDPHRCHVVYPGVEFARVHRRRDVELRRRLGYSDREKVLLFAGEATRAANPELAVWAAAILQKLEPSYRLLLWGRGLLAGRCENFGQQLNRFPVVTLAEQTLKKPMHFEELLPAADLVLCTASDSAPTLPLLTCMAAGLPIVSTVTYTVSELLEDRHNAVMVPHPTPRLLARRALDVFEDPGLQYRISDQARADVYEHFSKTKLIEAFSQIYAGLVTDALPVATHDDRISLP